MGGIPVPLLLAALSPVVLPWAVWLMSSRLPAKLRVWVAWFSGILFPAIAGWLIYRSEGSDAFAPFITATVVAATISIATIMVAEAWSARG